MVFSLCQSCNQTLLSCRQPGRRLARETPGTGIPLTVSVNRPQPEELLLPCSEKYNLCDRTLHVAAGRLWCLPLEHNPGNLFLIYLGKLSGSEFTCHRYIGTWHLFQLYISQDPLQLGLWIQIRVPQLEALMEDLKCGTLIKGQISAALANVAGKQGLKDAALFYSKILLYNCQLMWVERQL